MATSAPSKPPMRPRPRRGPRPRRAWPAHDNRAVTRGVVAAGHPLTAAAGAEILRAGGNAVDAALASMLASFVTEPLLTGLGAGGYMLVVPPAAEPVLLDFFVEASGRGADLEARAPLVAADVSFGDA